MKFSQLIEYSMRNTFLEKSCAKSGGESIHRPFFEKSKLKIPFDQYPKVSCNLFLWTIAYIETKLQTSCF